MRWHQLNAATLKPHTDFLIIDPAWAILKASRIAQFGGMKHVDMRKLPAAAQEERRRQVIGLRQAGLTYDAIAAQVGLSPTGVFDICQRFAEQGLAGLATGPRGPEPGYGRFLEPSRKRRPAL